jgi:hypothetical protein
MDKEAPCLVVGLLFILSKVAFGRTGKICTRRGHADRRIGE